MTESEQRVRLERDHEAHVARITIDNVERRNAYDPPMRRQMGAYLDELAADDDVKVVILRGAGGVFSTGADMQNAYAWYGNGESRRPSQRRRLGVDRESFAFYHEYLHFPKITLAQVETYALGGAFELALMSDLAVVARDAQLGMPGAKLLGPALGNLHLFFYRLGPVLARRLLLTGDTMAAGEVEHLGLFTEVCDPGQVPARAEFWAAKVARMPADGLAIAKAGFSLIEQTQAYVAEEATGFMLHAFATNLRFEDDEFNFVKTRAKVGTSEAFKLRDRHFGIDETHET
ncbi:MAG TPA: enoyl-CoA hydratase/isomerase family protein [Acidimicrobiia bacterium]|nr:enoyl-CoA hydratase/isomerase family protein [Acidimicrobiia bacterium]